MSTTTLTKEDILDVKRSWKEVLGIQNADEINPWHTRRVNRFLDQSNPDGKMKELDLATLLVILKSRGCVIDIPEYENTTVKKINFNQVKVGDHTRGKIIALKSNQDTFNFSVTILDEKYIEFTEKSNGCYDYAPRTYTITDYAGNFHNNWDKFVFTLTDKERAYFGNSVSADQMNIRCDKFATPQMAQTMYTEYYRNMKLLIERLVAERKYLNDTKKEYVKKLPKTENVCESAAPDKITVEEDKDRFESKVVKCFETKISIPTDFTFGYLDLKRTPQEIVDECNFLMKGIIDATGEYKFLCRTIEYAFTKMNPFKEGLMPSELQTYNRLDCKWNEQKVKLPRSRIEWFELCFKDYSLLCRYYDKTIKIKK